MKQMSLLVLIMFSLCISAFGQYESAAPSAYAEDAFGPVDDAAMIEQQSGYSAPLSEPQAQQYIDPSQQQQYFEQQEEAVQGEEFAPEAEQFDQSAPAAAMIESAAEVEVVRPRRSARLSLTRNRKHDIAPKFNAARQHIVKRQQYGRRNPVGAHRGNTFECRGGGCERAVAGRPKAPSGSRSNPRTKVDKLSVAFQAVKEELLQRAQELRAEKKWSSSVKSLIKNYRKKIHKVGDHVAELKRETKNLLRKKRQIQNAQIQKKLTSRLRIAQSDMSLLQKQLVHINNKESEFSATANNLKETMRQLRLHLRKLKQTKVPTVKHKPYKL